MLQVEYGPRYTLDVGWYPSWSTSTRGHFVIRIIEDYDWYDSLLTIEVKKFDQFIQALQKAVDFIVEFMEKKSYRPIRETAFDFQIKDSETWHMIDQIIDDLVQDRDIIETTAPECIITYMIQSLYKANLLLDLTFQKAKGDKKTIHPTFYPYKKTSIVWKTINKIIKDLVNNRDLVERTSHDYIVGYIINELRYHKIIDA